MSDAVYQATPNFYEVNGVRKFGYWVAENLKKEDLSTHKAHPELDELMSAGLGHKLIKIFNKNEVKASLFVIFTPGGIDFVGGYSYYQFLKQNTFEAVKQEEM